MKPIINLFVYIWSLLRSCLAYPFRSGSSNSQASYTRLQELSEINNLDFSNESFSQLVSRCRREFKLMLVYLHSEQHQDTDAFWSDVLQNEVFGEFLSSREFLVKMMDIQTTEGYQMSQKLQVTSYPFLGVLLVTSGGPQLVARSEGVLQLENILETLQAAYDRYHPVLVAERHDANERDLARRQREEQDRAFQEALERDRQREREQQEKERQEKERQEREEREKREKEERKNRIAQERDSLRSKFFDETGKSLEPAKGTENTCVIRFRFPNGSTIQRQFSRSDSVRSLYEFVHVLKPPMSTWEPSENADIENYQLATTYPKRVLNPEKSIQEEKCANETLLVHQDVDE